MLRSPRSFYSTASWWRSGHDSNYLLTFEEFRKLSSAPIPDQFFECATGVDAKHVDHGSCAGAVQDLIDGKLRRWGERNPCRIERPSPLKPLQGRQDPAGGHVEDANAIIGAHPYDCKSSRSCSGEIGLSVPLAGGGRSARIAGQLDHAVGGIEVIKPHILSQKSTRQITETFANRGDSAYRGAIGSWPRDGG